MSEPARIGDEYAQFLISVYELCAAAHLAHLQIEIATRSGARHTGVPSVEDDDLADWSSPTPRILIWIDHTPILLDQVTRCTTFAPSP